MLSKKYILLFFGICNFLTAEMILQIGSPNGLPSEFKANSKKPICVVDVSRKKQYQSYNKKINNWLGYSWGRGWKSLHYQNFQFINCIPGHRYRLRIKFAWRSYPYPTFLAFHRGGRISRYALKNAPTKYWTIAFRAMNTSEMIEISHSHKKGSKRYATLDCILVNHDGGPPPPPKAIRIIQFGKKDGGSFEFRGASFQPVCTINLSRRGQYRNYTNNVNSWIGYKNGPQGIHSQVFRFVNCSSQHQYRLRIEFSSSTYPQPSFFATHNKRLFPYNLKKSGNSWEIAFYAKKRTEKITISHIYKRGRSCYANIDSICLYDDHKATDPDKRKLRIIQVGKEDRNSSEFQLGKEHPVCIVDVSQIGKYQPDAKNLKLNAWLGHSKGKYWNQVRYQSFKFVNCERGKEYFLQYKFHEANHPHVAFAAYHRGKKISTVVLRPRRIHSYWTIRFVAQSPSEILQILHIYKKKDFSSYYAYVDYLIVETTGKFVEIEKKDEIPSGYIPKPKNSRENEIHSMLQAEEDARVDARERIVKQIRGGWVASLSKSTQGRNDLSVIERVGATKLVGVEEKDAKYNHKEGIVDVESSLSRAYIIDSLERMHGRLSQDEYMDLKHMFPSRITATGRGAWKTRAKKELKALRSAELDARRKLLEQLKGFIIQSSSRVENFVLKRHEVMLRVENSLLIGVKRTSEDFLMNRRLARVQIEITRNMFIYSTRKGLEAFGFQMTPSEYQRLRNMLSKRKYYFTGKAAVR